MVFCYGSPSIGMQAPEVNNNGFSTLPRMGHDSGVLDISVHAQAKSVDLKNCLGWVGLAGL